MQYTGLQTGVEKLIIKLNMTEALGQQLQAAEIVYYDSIGNPMARSGYMDYVTQDAERYLEELKRKEFPSWPGSVLGLIAAQGGPSLSDHRIRFQTWYVHLDDLVLDKLLLDFQQSELLISHTAEDAPKLASGRKDINYALTSCAFELVPVLTAIVESRQILSTAKKDRRPVKGFLGLAQKQTLA